MLRFALLCGMIAMLVSENGVSEAVRFVRQATNEVTSYCDRNRQTCDEVTERAATTGQWLADEGGAVAAQVMARLSSRRPTADSPGPAEDAAGDSIGDSVRAMFAAPARNPERGTLRDEDIRPAWRGP